MGKGFGYFTNYPFHVFLILTSEFCERFSYYGMRAVLVIFLWKGLGFSENASTIIYHTFVILCYFMPIIGAIIADGWLGKYRTIIYLSIVYAFGSLLMTAGAIPYHNAYINWISLVALFIIAFGTGGIKPCVSSFGGDQFSLDQARQKDSFFSIFYFTINVGSLISTILIPYIRGNVYCFGDTCYSLCFGIPAVLMIMSIVAFICGTHWYTIFPPGESIIQRLCGCIIKALSRKWNCKKSENEKKEHWLDYAVPDYDQTFVEDVKDVIRVTWLFLPLPIFWSLYDQQGSKWTFQAQQMNGDMGSLVVLPDQISFLNPFLVVLIIPILESVIYPCLDKIKILNRPLQKMVFGMTLAAVAFIIAGFLQIAIDGTQPAPIEPTKSKVQFLNVFSPSCSSTNFTFANTTISLQRLQATQFIYIDAGSYEIKTDCSNITETMNFESTKAYQVFLTENSYPMFLEDDLIHTDKGESIAKIFNGLEDETGVELEPQDVHADNINFGYVAVNNISAQLRLYYATFGVNLYRNGTELPAISSTIKTKNGPVYTFLLTEDNGTISLTQIEEIGAWTINIFLQAPQYLIMTIAELFFSPIGLAFSYSQAPATMKSILSAVWLLGDAVGNIIIIIIVSVAGSMKASTEFFIFAAIMIVTTIIYAIMCVLYKYTTPRDALPPSCSVATLSEAIKNNLGFKLDDDRTSNSSENELLPTKNLSSDGGSATSPNYSSTVDSSANQEVEQSKF